MSICWIRRLLFASVIVAALLPQSAVAAPTNVSLGESGSAEVVSCDTATPPACVRRFTGTAHGTPFDKKDMYVIIELQTSGALDSNGCQAVSGDVSFFRRLSSQGTTDTSQAVDWMKHLSTNSLYCQAGSGHTMTVPVTFGPAPKAGRYRAATGAGTMSLSDTLGNTTGSTGDWQAGETGTLDY